MKTTIFTLATVLTLQASLLFAGNYKTSEPTSSESSTIRMAILTTAAPMEATFEEAATVNDVIAFAPAAFSEASFDDIPAVSSSINDFSPAAAVTADFDDAPNMVASPDLTFLATPLTADFE